MFKKIRCKSLNIRNSCFSLVKQKNFLSDIYEYVGVTIHNRSCISVTSNVTDDQKCVLFTGAQLSCDEGSNCAIVDGEASCMYVVHVFYNYNTYD